MTDSRDALTEQLIAASYNKQTELVIIQEQLRNNANEYFVYAQTLALNYSDTNRVIHVCEAYEQSIKSYASFDNLFAYGEFLHRNDHPDEAALIYQCLLSFDQINPSNRKAAVLRLLMAIQTLRRSTES